MVKYLPRLIISQRRQSFNRRNLIGYIFYVFFVFIILSWCHIVFFNTLHDKDESLSVYKLSTEAVKSVHGKDLMRRQECHCGMLLICNEETRIPLPITAMRTQEKQPICTRETRKARVSGSY